MGRLAFLVRKEFQELRRNPRMFPVIFVAPVIQLGILGYAAATDVKNVPVVVLDADRSAASRDLVGRFEGSPYFSVARVTSSDADVRRDIESRRAWMAVAIPGSRTPRPTCVAPAGTIASRRCGGCPEAAGSAEAVGSAAA